MSQVEMAKKPINLTADPDLLKEARELGLNLSEIFERGLRDALAKERSDKWLSENKEAVDAYNRHVERDGVFSNGLRRF